MVTNWPHFYKLVFSCSSVFHCLTLVDPFVSSTKKSVRAFILCIGDFTLQKTLITTFVSFVRVWLKAIVFLHPYGLFLHQLLFCLIISSIHIALWYQKGWLRNISMKTEKSFSTMLSWLPSGTYLMYQYFDIIETYVDVHDGFICVFLWISQRFFLDSSLRF